MVGVPITSSKLAVPSILEIGREIGDRIAGDMEISKKHNGKSTNSTKLHMLVAKDPVLVEPTSLVVLGVIC